MNYYQEGMGYQENWLPYYQKRLGNEVSILTSDKYFPFPDYENNFKDILGDRKVGQGIFSDKQITIIRKKSTFEISRRAMVAFNVREYIHSFNPDIIHIHGITNINFFQVLLSSKNKSIKIFVDSHSDYQVSNHKHITNRIYYKIWRGIYSIFKDGISGFLPTTLEAKYFLEKELGIQGNNVVINHLGVNTDVFFNDNIAIKSLRQKYNLGDKFVLMNAGKQNPSKKTLFILSVMNELVLKFNRKDIVLFLIGSGSPEFEQQINKQLVHISDYVVRLPFQKNSELKDFYSLADIGIWPGVPSNTIQEAMACEVAMILPTNDTISHLIDSNGFFIDSFEAEQIAYKITDIIDKNKLPQYKINSRKLALKYSWENIAKSCLNIYEE